MKPPHDPSEPLRVKEERDVLVAMRDGVRLAADVFRPGVEGRYPALLALSPYGKWKQSVRILPQSYLSPLFDAGIEAGDPYYLVAHSYAHVIADCRGTGRSEGSYRGWMSADEGRDGHDLVEWIAAQPWCDGNVGMVGVSYFGTIQLAVASQRPPHLKAIMPWNAVADFYREATHHGGIFQTFFTNLYSGRVASTRLESDTDREAPSVRDPARRALLSDQDLRMYPDLFMFADSPARNPCIYDILVHGTDGEFYWSRSAYTMYDKITIPSYCESGWWAYAHMHLVGAFMNYAGISAPKKLRISDRRIEDRPLGAEYNDEVLRWYDYWLKGIDTGIMTEPPIRIYVNGAEEWRFEQEWPLARTEWRWFYLGPKGSLASGRRPAPSGPDRFVQQPLSEGYGIASATYSTGPLERDLELTGPAALYLRAAIDQTDTNWMVSLRDIGPGSETELSKGFLKASHRALDQSEGARAPWSPRHPHTRVEPVVPGTVYEYAIALAPLSNVFKSGHEVKLVISSMDHSRSRDTKVAPMSMGAGHYPWHVCSSKRTAHEIYFDGDDPSRVILPVIP